MTVDEIVASDMWTVAYRMHLDGIRAGLHDRCAFERCSAHPCVLWRAASPSNGSERRA